MARSVRTRPDPGQLAFLLDLDVREQPKAAALANPRPRVAPLVAPSPPPAAEPVPEPTSLPGREPQGHVGGLEPGGEPDWRAVLDFERGWSGTLPAKQRAVRERFGVTSARYHQLLDRALELPDALTHDPALVGRLRRIRETRRGKRFARRVDTSGVSPRDREAWREEGPTGG